MDSRTTINKNTILILDKEYTIIKEIGRGSNSIVYEAYFDNNISLKQKVIIKQYNPIHEFDLDTYLQSIYHTINLFHTTNLTNHINNIINVYQAYHTCFIIISLYEGTLLSKANLTIDEAIQVIIKLCEIIKNIHHTGYLYIDLKADNVLLLNGGGVLLFDFDSLIPMNQKVKTYTPCIAPREITQHTGTYTDTYMLGMLLYYMIFHTYPKSIDILLGIKINLNYTNMIICLETILNKSLSYYKDRYLTCDELLYDLKQLSTMSLKDPYLIPISKFPLPYILTDENKLKELMKQYHHIQFRGIDGIGKRTKAKQYARNYQYAYIIHHPYDLIDDLIIPINNTYKHTVESDEDYYKRKMNLFASLVNQDVLIIIDSKENCQDYLKLNCDIIVIGYDYNLKEYKIPPLTNNQLTSLFKHYCNKEVDDNLLLELFKITNYHTLVIELIAKQLNYGTSTLTKDYLHQYFNYANEKVKVTNQYQVEYIKPKDVILKMIQKNLNKQEINTLKQLAKFTDIHLSYFALITDILIERCYELENKGYVIIIDNNAYVHPVIKEALLSKETDQLMIHNLYEHFNCIKAYEYIINSYHTNEIEPLLVKVLIHIPLHYDSFIQQSLHRIHYSMIDQDLLTELFDRYYSRFYDPSLLKLAKKYLDSSNYHYILAEYYDYKLNGNYYKAKGVNYYYFKQLISCLKYASKSKSKRIYEASLISLLNIYIRSDTKLSKVNQLLTLCINFKDYDIEYHVSLLYHYTYNIKDYKKFNEVATYLLTKNNYHDYIHKIIIPVSNMYYEWNCNDQCIEILNQGLKICEEYMDIEYYSKLYDELSSYKREVEACI